MLFSSSNKLGCFVKAYKVLLLRGDMTTLIGIKAEKGEDAGVILSADRCMTVNTNDSNEIKVIEGTKLRISEDNQFAIATSGFFDQHLEGFLSEVLGGGIDIEKVLNRGYFPALKKVNLDRWSGRVPTDNTSSLLIAARFGDPQLYSCFPLGRAEKTNFTSLGSGSNYVFPHLIGKDEIIPGGISLERAVDLSVEAMGSAYQDLNTRGLDMVAVTRKGIYVLGEDIRKEVDQACAKAIEKSKRKLRAV